MRRELAFARRGSAAGPDADAVSHEYAASLTLARDDLTGPATLEVGGIATVWDLLVNGVLVGSGRSMFERCVIEVGEQLRPGDNEVLVRVHPLTDLLDEQPRKPRARWRTMLSDESRLRWVRTSILGRAPGFAPGPPVVGPWRPMVLVTGETVRVRRLRLRPSVVGAAGRLDVDVAVTGATAVLVVELAGVGRVEVELVDGRGHAAIDVPDVGLWWPHTHGTPTLYDVRVRHGDSVLEERRVGFRALVNDVPGSVALRVNDVPVFVRGAVWTPGDPTALETAVELGFNLVRVTGVATYESDAFHARCDELGLMVWQDLMFATFDYPLADAGFVATVEAEVAQETARLLGHPSTVVVCGSAEHEQQAAMFGVRPETGAAGELAAMLRPVVEASGLDAVWVDSSPTGGDLPIRVDTGVAQYFGLGAYLRELPDARHCGVRFASECLAFSNLADPVVDGGVPRDNGADWDFADVRRHYLRARYGTDATREQEQRVTGEVMADVFGEWRRPASPCAGGIVLWLRDLEPGAGWGLLDDSGRPKPAALALAPTLQPTAVWFVDEGLNGLDVHVAHDRSHPDPATLVVELLRGDGSVLDGAESAWELRPHSHRVLHVDGLLGRFADSSYAYRFGPAPHDSVTATLTGAFGTRVATWRVTTPARA